MAAKNVSIRGGKKLEKKLKALMASKQKVKGYDVGFFASAEYSIKTKKGRVTNIPVAFVAATNEFGAPSKNIPERPFFRIANKNVEKDLVKYVKNKLTLEDNYVLSEQEVHVMAQIHEGAVKESITKLSSPPNAETTVRQKKSTNPLIDTGKMRQSVTSKVVV